ncbi:unnamed protein product [Orchesella dallaii]|uniref:RlpA-like protein double-psi beta-barrel domain-containing protein n=1 Tax=Orchesella dallaii TaxID=48710 RepID=A0ABP1RE11_9HEXA
MGRYLNKSLILYAFLSLFYPSSASILDWLTGSSASTESPNVPQFPEESGECSHWGNAALAPFSPHDPLHFGLGLPLRGDLVGSYVRVPIGTIVLVTNMKNGNTVRVRVVPPRSTPVLGRVMDLSPAAFAQLENVREGVFTCSVKVLQTPRAETEVDALHSHSFENGPKSGPSPFLSTAKLESGSLGFFKRQLLMNSNYPPII